MKIKKNQILLLTIVLTNFFLTFSAKAQVAIGDEKVPEPYSLLELIASSKKGGLSLPRLNDAELTILTDQILALKTTNVNAFNEARGLVIFNTDIGCMEFWNSEKWVSLCEGSVKATLSVDLNELYFDSKGNGRQTVIVTTNQPGWTTSIEYNPAIAGWVTVFPASSSIGSGRFSVTVGVNDTPFPREATITVMSTGGTEIVCTTVTVIQSGTSGT